MMTNDMGDTAKLSEYIAEARTMGIEVLAPDVNESHLFFAPAQEGTVIRFGLAAIKGVGEPPSKSCSKPGMTVESSRRFPTMRAGGWSRRDAQDARSAHQNGA